MKVLSLFDGISCARVALERAGIPVEVYYASEIDKYAIQVSRKNYPDIVQLGSVLKVGGVPNNNWQIDLLIGGSPCQDLSIAKKDRKGLSGERSGLFYEYVRILNEVKPKYFILENVNSMPKEAKETITKELFGIEPVMINASLVSAQNRKRLFWVGKFVGSDEAYTYDKVDVPQPEDKGILLKDILEENVDEKYYVKINEKYGLKGLCGSDEKSKSMTASMHKGYGNDGVTTVRIGSLNSGGQGDRIYSLDGKSVNLSANGGGRGAKTGLYAIKIPEATKKGYAEAHEGQSVDLSFPKSKTRRGRVGDKVKNIMTSQNIGVVQNMQIRKLTPIECERLQGLPDNYTEGVSNTQRYKCLGNAFNVDVIAHILRNIK